MLYILLLYLLLGVQVRMIVELLPVKRQNMMFSATIPPRIERMAKELMKEGIKITIGEV